MDSRPLKRQLVEDERLESELARMKRNQERRLLLHRGRKNKTAVEEGGRPMALVPPAKPDKVLIYGGEDTGEIVKYEQDDTFWLEDGNFVLVSKECRGFRVHLDILAMHCHFFQNMNQHAHPKEPTLLDDTSEDIKWLLTFVYKPFFFTPGTPTSYQQLAGMLRVSTKYLCNQLREAVISHLTQIYPRDPAKIGSPSPLIPPENASNHPLFAIDMCKSNNVPQILPVAYLLAATLPNTPLRHIYPALSFEDELVIHRGRVRLRDAIMKAWSYVTRKDPLCQGDKAVSLGSVREDPVSMAVGGNKARCDHGKTTVCRAIVELDTLQPLTLFLQGKSPRMSGTDVHDICLECRNRWIIEEKEQCEQVWQSMPEYFELPPW